MASGNTHHEVQNSDLFWRGLRKSAAAHAIISIAAVIMSFTFSKSPIKINPSVRVDLVALPDIAKKDLSHLEPTNDMDELKQKLDDATKDAQKPVEAQKKEVVVPKVVPKPPDDAMTVKKEKSKEKSKNKTDLKNAIDRIKAISEIENEVKKQKPKLVVKGNNISKGNSLTGDPSTDTNAYVGKMQSKLHENWNLPVWLSKQDLNAKVLLLLDRAGYVSKILISKSSGNKQFDDYVMKTVRLSQPFGPPPDDILEAGLTLGFPL